MASTIKIKRSGLNSVPSQLASGELAYSWLSNTLYIGTGVETGGVAANVEAIGGTAFTSLLDHTPGQLTASSAIIVDANSKIDNLYVDNLQLNGNTLSTTNANGDLFITPNGTGKTVISNLYIGDTATSLQEYIQDVSGGSIANSSEISATYDDNTGTTSLELNTTGVAAGSYGSTTEIPTFTVDSKGRLTAASTVSVATTLSIVGDTGSDSVSLLSDTLSVLGGEGIDVAVTDNTITISGELASTTNAGVASFNSNSFDVVSGAVSIKSGGVSNSQLANSDITIGTTTVSLGETSTSLFGLTELEIDNLNINGNEIQSTNANGDIILNPNGTGNIDVSAAKITNLAEPVNPTDAATKNYVDNAVAGLTWKQAVHLLADSNVSLTGSTSTLVIDGHAALDQADSGVYRILLTGQTTDTENGIYVYTDNGTSYTLTRATDSDVYTELVGASVWILEGATYANTGWTQSEHYLTSFANQDWVQFSGAGSYIAGAGLGQSGTEFFVKVATDGGIEIVSDELRLKSTLAGDGLDYNTGVLSVNVDNVTLAISNDTLEINSGYAGQTSITTLGTITTGTWSADTIAVNKGGTGLTSYSTGDLLYASGSASLSKLSIGDTGKVLQVNASGLPVWGDIDGGTY